MLVLDTSAAVAAVAEDPPNERVIERIAADAEPSSPHLIDAEFVHALRGFVRRGEMTAERASRALADFGELTIVRYPLTRLRDRMWQLRDNLTAYDAAFVTLAEALDCPLITTDGRLARTTGHQATIEVF